MNIIYVECVHLGLLKSTIWRCTQKKISVSGNNIGWVYTIPRKCRSRHGLRRSLLNILLQNRFRALCSNSIIKTQKSSNGLQSDWGGIGTEVNMKAFARTRSLETLHGLHHKKMLAHKKFIFRQRSIDVNVQNTTFLCFGYVLTSTLHPLGHWDEWGFIW